MICSDKVQTAVEHLHIGQSLDDVECVIITHEWLRDMRQGDALKQSVWQNIMTHRNTTGYPYVKINTPHTKEGDFS